MKEIKPLSGEGKLIQYNRTQNGFKVSWGDTNFEVSSKTIDLLLSNLFANPKAWYPLGASMTPVYKHGLGEFLLNLDVGLTPRHASAVAAILVNEKKLKSKGAKPIYLSRL